MTAVDRPGARARRFAGGSAVPVVAFVVIATVLAVTQHVSNRVLRQRGYEFLRWKGAHEYLDGWAQFDAVEYLRIAEHGYSYTPGVRSSVVWFPMFPLATRAVNAVIGDPMLAGIAVSFVAGLVAVILYWRWLCAHVPEDSARLSAFAALLLYPYAWYIYGVPHSDAMFLAFLVGACLLVEADRPVLAGCVGALATATRPNGLALIAAILVLSMQHDGVLSFRPAGPDAGRVRRWLDRYEVPLTFERARCRPRTFAPLLSVAGVGSYMVYLGVRFGDPIAFVTNSRTYHESPWPLLKLPFLVAWRDVDDPTFPLTLTAQALFALLVVLSVPAVGRRFGWGYGILVALLVAMPLATVADFMGTGRYLIAAFPVAALWGERLASRPRVRLAWFAVAGVALVGLNMGFSRSWYLS